MAYKKISLSDLPKKPRKAFSRFERTPEWKAMRADLERGLKPREALQVVLTEEDKKKYHIQNRRTIARFFRKYLRDHKLPYALKSFTRDSADFFLIFRR